MKISVLSSITLALLLGAIPVFFASSTATAVADRAIEVRAENTVEKARDNANAITNNSSRSAELLAEKEQRLTAKKLQACNKKQDKFKSRMQQISDRGTKQLEVFRKIADRTKAFYETKGYTSDGYVNLAAEVDARYSQAAAAIGLTQSSQNEWSCDDSSPLSAMQGFSDAKKNEIAALKAYKDKVRQLILLVKQAGGNQ